MEYIDSLHYRALDRLDRDSDADQIPLQAIIDLMRRKWWTRIWVVQEALMSWRVIVESSKMGTIYFKARIREWESRMSKEVKIKNNQGLATAVSHQLQRIAKRGRDLKFSMIRYLLDNQISGKSNFYREIQRLRGRFVQNYQNNDLIKNYEEWMQSPGCDACGFSKDTPHGSSSGLGASERLGQKIVALTADKTMFLTEYGYHHVERFAVKDGDIICWLSNCFAHFILRKADKENWTLVGYFLPKSSTGERKLRDLAPSQKLQVFRPK